MIIPVILSGGSGTRLWPLSRKLYPKQLLALTGKMTLIQQTAGRLSGLKECGPPLVICNEAHRFMVAEQFRQAKIAQSSIILEPMGKNTAPAAALACYQALAQNPEEPPLLLILPADHLIRDQKVFQAAISAGIWPAKEGKLVTFGIIPQSPETGYGYIKRGEHLDEGKGDTPAYPVYRIDRFVEKPDLPTAESYVASGEYLWNSGMFLFRADRYLEELKKYNPQMDEACREAYTKAVPDLDFLRIDHQAFAACPSDSIDYTVMEKTDRGVMIPIDPGWNDIGSWSALWEVSEQDTNGNVIIGDVMTMDTEHSYIHAENRLIATIGIHDQIIVETADVVLVADKNKVQEVKEIVNRLQLQGRSEVDLHRRVYRPWGSYEGITTGERFQVKRITVNPGAILSLQMHHHRAEHWIVVKGTARITRGEEEFVLGENESTYIPLGTTHRLENPGKIPLEIIEVQSGSYLGEDDIVRLKDQYGR
ncbi:MAG: mannose-1-phosphate guanylyltransferase/mannose-6-phosphate isomerase [Proteobacteria bacterium]|nr:mannose-1-phosphate guanylyltransferase/mannose-6-phosphate isomerase [Pseudomonadota bacterium]MBU1688202.1 mannose-1-phosphate guanylyltransferase/mannose-6-phosphate isomerase [Pseudomonadota bacterium]